MNIVTTFDPSVTTTDTFTVPQSSANGKMVVYNESNVSLKFHFQNGSTAYVPAWTAILFCGPFGNVNVTWQQQATLSSASPPLSMVIVETYASGEPVPGTFPAALVRQTNIGNAVNTVSGVSASIQNNGNTPATSIIEATPSDAGSSTWQADNSGNLTVKSDNAGTLITLLQLIAGASPSVKLAAATVLTEVLGNLKVDGSFESVGATTLDSTLTVTGDATFNGTGTGVSVAHNLGVTGTSSLDNGTLTTDGSGNILWAGKLGVSSAGDRLDASGGTTYVKASGEVHIQIPNGTDHAVFATSDLTINGSTARMMIHKVLADNFSLASGGAFFGQSGSWTRFSTFTGTTTGTYNHGLGATPDHVMPCQNAVGSQTMGYDSLTSSQVHITSGAGASFKALCYKA